MLKGGMVMAIVLMLSAVSLSAQQTSVSVTGTVVDEGNFPLEGVGVVIKGAGTSGGTTTDANGKYSIEVPSGSTIVFIYLGYSDYEAAVGKGGVVNVQMEPDAQALEESVVVGYGTQRKKDLTGGVAVVDEEVLNMSSTSNLMDRLVGQVAGLTITTSDAAPGSNQSLLIRGQNSLSGSNSPLIVLDGIPYDGSLADIDPNIIESMSVLKDTVSSCSRPRKARRARPMSHTRGSSASRNLCSAYRPWDRMNISASSRISTDSRTAIRESCSTLFTEA